jgi:hypothetical protein
MKIFGGLLVGGFATFVLPLLSLGIIDATGIGFGTIIVALLLVPIVGVGLMFGGPTRPWGIGLLIGWAIVLIVVGGSCVAIIASLNGSL